MPGFLEDANKAAMEANKMKEIVLEPYWPAMVRWHANALATHSFDFGAKSPLGTFMQMVGYLAQKDPEELNKIIEEFQEPRVIQEAEDILEQAEDD